MIFDYYQFMLNFMLSVNDALIVLLLFIRLNFWLVFVGGTHAKSNKKEKYNGKSLKLKY